MRRTRRMRPTTKLNLSDMIIAGALLASAAVAFAFIVASGADAIICTR
jgi:hypothetical protein